MLKILLFLWISLEAVRCGPNLCDNKINIDSITWVNHSSMWFFTSGGHYWLVKEQDFPPKEPGLPLPEPFKKGEAAFYKDMMNGCEGIKEVEGKEVVQEQEIYLLEFIDGKIRVMIYDFRYKNWLEGVKPYEEYKDLQQVKIDMTKPIDAAFTYNLTYIALIQNDKYAFVDLKPLCYDSDNYGKSYQVQSIADFNHQDQIRGMTIFRETSLLLFSGDSYWMLTNVRLFSSKGQITAIKEGSQKIRPLNSSGMKRTANCLQKEKTQRPKAQNQVRWVNKTQLTRRRQTQITMRRQKNQEKMRKKLMAMMKIFHGLSSL